MQSFSFFNEKSSMLVVDDNEINLLVAYHSMKNECRIIDFAKNGVEALEKVLIGSYDIVLMDYAMPLMDGVEATKLIRASESLPKQPLIIGLTAFDNGINQMLEAGMDAAFVKPCSKAVLMQEILKKITLEVLVDR